MLAINISTVRNVIVASHEYEGRKYFLTNFLTGSLFNFEVHVENGQLRVVANCKNFLVHVLDQNRIAKTITEGVGKFDIVFEERTTPY